MNRVWEKLVSATTDSQGRTLWENYGRPRLRGLAWRIKRSWALLRLYWGTEDCDWSTIALVMRFQIRRTRLHVLNHNIVSDAQHIARQMLIVETLLTRMLDEPYYEIANAVYGFTPGSIVDELNTQDKQIQQRRKHWAQHITALSRQDSAMLGRILTKHFRSWWD